MKDLKKAAIKAAIDGDWNRAIKLNEQIVSVHSDNVQALNRLAFAHLQIGNIKQAVKMCSKALKLDPNHPIAERNLKIARQLSLAKRIDKQKVNQLQPKPDVFVKEPGKTRQVILINPATQSFLTTLYAGQEVKLQPTRKTIEVRTLEGDYIGALPDDVSFHLKNLIALGNHYSAHIKKARVNHVYVFIRETKRGKRVKMPTFGSFR